MRRSALLVAALTVVVAGLALALVAQAPPAERIPHFAENRPAVIAHAGAQAHAPANTVPAFELALELGADTLEMDLQLTADDEVVVHHDGTVDRQTDGTGTIRDMTLDELSTLDAGYRFEADDGTHPYRGRGVRVPTLDEVFEAFPDAFMILEMKTDGGPEIVPAVADLVRAHARQDSVVVASFSLEYVQEFRARLPGVPTNMPEGEVRDFYWRHLVGLDRWYEPPAEAFQVPEFHQGRRVVTRPFVAAAQRRGLEVQVWTVNDRADMHRLLALGVGGIITDHPELAAEVVAQRAAGAAVEGHAGLGTVEALQRDAPWLTPVMRAITGLGDEDFYVLVFPLVFWAVSRRLGLQLGLLLLVSAGLNETLKLVTATPRPGFLAPGVAAVQEATFGIPSGHAQNAVVVWGLVASWMRRRWAWAAAGALAFVLGASRVQLGVHFPQDVVIGWAVGAMLLAAFLRWGGLFADWLGSCGPRAQVRVAAGGAAGLVALAAGARAALLGWQVPPGWVGVGAELWPVAVGPVVTPAGALLGVALGVVWLGRRGGFDTGGSLPRRVVRCLVGLLGVVVVWQGLGAILPAGEDPLALTLRFVRYALVGAWVAGFAPALFVRLGLARAATPARPDGAHPSTTTPTSMPASRWPDTPQ